MQIGWQKFRTESQTREQLKEAGFRVLEVIYDSQGMFPTVIAAKPAEPSGDLRIVERETLFKRI